MFDCKKKFTNIKKTVNKNTEIQNPSGTLYQDGPPNMAVNAL